MATYGWIITKDLIETEQNGVYGPADVPDEIAAELQDIYLNPTARRNELGIKYRRYTAFRMLDDDGIPYYEGVYLGNGIHEFGNPLWDHGEPYAGCTRLEVKGEDDNWYPEIG